MYSCWMLCLRGLWHNSHGDGKVLWQHQGHWKCTRVWCWHSALVVEFYVLERRRSTWSTPKESTSTSSFFAYRLAYSSHASMIMPKFWCQEYETGSLYFGPLLKRSLSFTLRTILRSHVTIWPHGAYRNCESEQLQGGRSWERPWKSSCCYLAL